VNTCYYIDVCVYRSGCLYSVDMHVWIRKRDEVLRGECMYIDIYIYTYIYICVYTYICDICVSMSISIRL